jgi:hypothetical protein
MVEKANIMNQLIAAVAKGVVIVPALHVMDLELSDRRTQSTQ